MTTAQRRLGAGTISQTAQRRLSSSSSSSNRKSSQTLRSGERIVNNRVVNPGGAVRGVVIGGSIIRTQRVLKAIYGNRQGRYVYGTKESRSVNPSGRPTISNVINPKKGTAVLTSNAAQIKGRFAINEIKRERKRVSAQRKLIVDEYENKIQRETKSVDNLRAQIKSLRSKLRKEPHKLTFEIIQDLNRDLGRAENNLKKSKRELKEFKNLASELPVNEVGVGRIKTSKEKRESRNIKVKSKSIPVNAAQGLPKRSDEVIQLNPTKQPVNDFIALNILGDSRQTLNFLESQKVRKKAPDTILGKAIFKFDENVNKPLAAKTTKPIAKFINEKTGLTTQKVAEVVASTEQKIALDPVNIFLKAAELNTLNKEISNKAKVKRRNFNQFKGGLIKGTIEDVRDKPGTQIVLFATGYGFSKFAAPAVKIAGGKTLIKVAPYLKAGRADQILKYTRVGSKVVKGAAIAGFGGLTAYEASQQGTPQAAGEVVGKNVVRLGSFVGGSAVAAKGGPLSGLQREAERTRIVLDTLGNRDAFAASKELTSIERSLTNTRFPKNTLKNLDARNIQGLNAKESAKLNKYLAKSNKEVFGSLSQKTYPVDFLESGTIKRTPTGITGKPRIVKDIDLATKNVISTEKAINKITGGKIKADIKSTSTLKNNPFSRSPIKVGVAGQKGKVKIPRASEQLARKVAGSFTIRETGGVPTFYRGGKDIPDALQLSRSLSQYSNPITRGRVLTKIANVEKILSNIGTAQYQVGTGNVPAKVRLDPIFSGFETSSATSSSSIIPGYFPSSLIPKTANKNILSRPVSSSSVDTSSLIPPAGSSSIPASSTIPKVSSGFYSKVPKTSSPALPSRIASNVFNPSPSKSVARSASISPSKPPSSSSSKPPSPGDSKPPSPSDYYPLSSSSPSPGNYEIPSTILSSSAIPNTLAPPIIYNFAAPIPELGGGGFAGGGYKKPKRPFKYLPTIRATALNIKLPKRAKTKKLKLTGLEIRGIPKGFGPNI